MLTICNFLDQQFPAGDSNSSSTQSIYDECDTLLKAAKQDLLVESIFLVLYTALITISAVITLRTGIRTLSRSLIIAACIMMYLMAAAHFWLSLTALGQGNGCQPSVLLGMTMVLSDILVAWRACVMWPQSRAVKGLALTLVSAALILNTVGLNRNVCVANWQSIEWGQFLFLAAAEDYPASITPATDFVDIWGSVSVAVSWLTNIFSTSAISYKAWRHRQTIRKAFSRGSPCTQVERVLLLFIESGVVYCILWTLHLAGAITNMVEGAKPAGDSSKTALDFFAWLLKLKSSALIDLIGIYPTLVIILVAHAKRAALPKSSSDIDLEHITPLPRRDLRSPARNVSSDSQLDSTISLYILNDAQDEGENDVQVKANNHVESKESSST